MKTQNIFLPLAAFAAGVFLAKRNTGAAVGASLKISPKVWNSYNQMEKDHVLSRYDIEDLFTIKNRLKDAKKFLPGYTKIYGKGFLEDGNGKTYLWSGNDTRQFHLVKWEH
jgi:hypothetical protein